MKYLILSLLFFSTSPSLASMTPLNKKQVLRESGLKFEQIISQTEKSLEEHLFFSQDGRSCGLQSFYLEGFQTPNNLLTESLNKFSVITDVYAPIYPCQGYERALCETEWQKQASWEINQTLCNNDPL